MHIMTANGWRMLEPRGSIQPRHVASLLEMEGIEADSEHEVAAQYSEAIHRFVKLPREHPLSISEQEMIGILGQRNVVPGWSKL